MNLISNIKDGEFLPANVGVITSDFAVSDSKELFLKNLKTQPLDWYYRTNTVTYKTNSQNYRTSEFKNIDWANSVVIFGCSEVFGVGVDEAHTVGNFLSDLIGMPVINLGVPSTSIMFALHNSLILNQHYPTPKAVIHLWTDYSRTVSYKKYGVVHHGAWDLDKDNYMLEWAIDDLNPSTYALFTQMISHQIWKLKTVYYEASIFPATVKLFECDQLYSIDYARDLIHCGINSKRAIAGQIAKNIKRELN